MIMANNIGKKIEIDVIERECDRVAELMITTTIRIIIATINIQMMIKTRIKKISMMIRMMT